MPIKKIAILSHVVIMFLSCGYFLYKHFDENTLIENFLLEKKLSSGMPSKKNAIRISDSIRSIINVNKKNWKTNEQNLNKVSFFRMSVKDIITSKEGTCGEGARLLVRLLLKLNYDATRVNLFTKNFGADGHTVVSVLIDNKEYFIDTINSTDLVNKILVENDVSSKTFIKVYYDQRFDDSIYIKKKNEYLNSPVWKKDFNDLYVSYSYDALPFTRAVSVIGYNMRVFNFTRPNLTISYLAESVNLLYLFVFLVGLNVIYFFIYLTFFFKKTKDCYY